MNTEGFGDNFGDRHPWVKGRKGILKDRLHPPAEGAELGTGGTADDFLTVERDGSGRGRNQPQDHPGDRALAGSRLPDQTQGFAPGDGEGDLVDHALLLARVPPSGAPRIIFGELVNFEQSHAPDGSSRHFATQSVWLCIRARL